MVVARIHGYKYRYRDGIAAVSNRLRLRKKYLEREYSFLIIVFCITIGSRRVILHYRSTSPSRSLLVHRYLSIRHDRNRNMMVV